MAFQELNTLDADTTIALGGVNKKTGKKNPTKAEGYYLGYRKVDSAKSKSGQAFLHFLQTPTGNIGVWGKTDLDRKLTQVTPGVMVRINQTGTVPTPNGTMYKYKVEVDPDNTIDVNFDSGNDNGGADEAANDDINYDNAGSGQTYDNGAEEDEAQNAALAAATKARRQAEVQAILSGKGKK